MKLPKIIISDFCKKNFFEKEKLDPSIQPQGVLNAVERNFKKARHGYRLGVLLVPINPLKFKCPVVELKDGMTLCGEFRKRMDSEEPRKKLGVPNVPFSSARFCDVVLYSKEVLLEGKENTGYFVGHWGDGYDKLYTEMVNGFADWEIISILPKLDEDQPMPPDTLMYNHFQLSGGTKTNMSNDEFVEELKKSFTYWKDKAMVW
jgi:hypothetical protein